MIKFNGDTGDVQFKGTQAELMADLATIVFYMINTLEIDKNFIKIAVTDGIKQAKEEA